MVADFFMSVPSGPPSGICNHQHYYGKLKAAWILLYKIPCAMMHEKIFTSLVAQCMKPFPEVKQRVIVE